VTFDTLYPDWEHADNFFFCLFVKYEASFKGLPITLISPITVDVQDLRQYLRYQHSCFFWRKKLSNAIFSKNAENCIPEVESLGELFLSNSLSLYSTGSRVLEFLSVSRIFVVPKYRIRELIFF